MNHQVSIAISRYFFSICTEHACFMHFSQTNDINWLENTKKIFKTSFILYLDGEENKTVYQITFTENNRNFIHS